MFALVMSALHLALATMAGGALSDAGALSLAVVVSIALVALLVVSLAAPAPGGTSRPHPRRAIDLSVLLSQSDPNASGHPRPRAPGAAVPVA
jgi:hypothetical protein